VGKGSAETKFGVTIDDPFRWLEDDSEETRAWQSAKNRDADDYFAKRAALPAMRARITDLLRTGYCELPCVTGKRAFYTRREGDAQQPKLVVRENGQERALIDAEKLSADATDALDWWYPSPRGTRVAWGRSSAGSEQSVLHVRDVATGEDLDVRIPNTQHCMVGWTTESTFFYVRYPEGDPYDARVYFHELGRDWKNDRLVFGEGRDKTDVPVPLVSPDGRFLVIVVQQGWSKTELWLRDLETETFVPLTTGEEAIFEPIVRREALWVMTNSGAARYRLFRVDWKNPKREHWREVLAEKDDVLTSVAIGEPRGSGAARIERVVATYLRDASSVLIDGDREIALPSIGSATVTSSPDDEDVYVGFTSFVVPLGVWKLDDTLVPWAQVSSKGPGDVVVEKRFAKSKDGTRLPMFVVKKRDATAPARCVLYGYGGFNVNQTPAFSARVLSFVERGGTWVSSVLRGGGEYGEAWHKAGMLDRKQNVFDDFFACAESLLADGTTTKDALAAVGGSNGGLLVSAAVVQRPDLFAAGVALVPLADMLRYHVFRLGQFWISEYGSPDVEAEFHVLYKYSPYHHVETRAYPAMLFWAAESDSRVDPMHARKMTAAMQSATTSGRSIVLRVETKAGHGMGKPTAKVADQLACELAFIEEETRT
jgi:prolyl oligopeptidase